MNIKFFETAREARQKLEKFLEVMVGTSSLEGGVLDEIDTALWEMTRMYFVETIEGADIEGDDEANSVTDILSGENIEDIISQFIDKKRKSED